MVVLTKDFIVQHAQEKIKEKGKVSAKQKNQITKCVITHINIFQKVKEFKTLDSAKVKIYFLTDQYYRQFSSLYM